MNQVTFHGTRLREARQARAFTATRLAGLVGVSPSSISQYESNARTPPPMIVAKLSLELDLPPHYFTTPPTETVSNCFRWRSQSAATKASRERAQQKYEWFRCIMQSINTRVELPAPNIPTFDLPDDPGRITQEDIDSLADKVRQLWGLGKGPISNIIQLVENNGGLVVRSEMGDDALDAFSDFHVWTGRCYIMLSTSKNSAVRSRHCVGHELGHVILHRNVPDNVSRRPPVHKEMESQADRFASALLLPSTTFPAEVFSVTLDGLLHLKRRWGVAVSAMIMRLADLNLIDDARKQSLFMQMSKRGWRRHEPLDDELVLEQPNLVRRSLDAVLQAKVLDVEELLNPPLHLSEVEKLLGLNEGYLTGGRQSPVPFQLRLVNSALP